MAEVLPVLRIKRRSALILPLTVLAVAFAFWMRVGPVIPVDGAAAQIYQTVVLDPGHGGRMAVPSAGTGHRKKMSI